MPELSSDGLRHPLSRSGLAVVLLTEDYDWHRQGGNVVGIEATKKVMKNWFETSVRE